MERAGPTSLGILLTRGPHSADAASAVALARAGASVCVVEAADEIGGGTRSAELTLPGFLHVVCAAVHPMGSMSLGDDPKKSVVKSTGEHHQVERLFVLDGSLFPTSLGAPPQISIYSFSRHLSKHVAERLARRVDGAILRRG